MLNYSEGNNIKIVIDSSAVQFGSTNSEIGHIVNLIKNKLGFGYVSNGIAANNEIRTTYLIDRAVKKIFEQSGVVNPKNEIDGVFIASITNTYEVVKNYFDNYLNRKMTTKEALMTDNSLVGSKVTITHNMEGVNYRFFSCGRTSGIHAVQSAYIQLLSQKSHKCLIASSESTAKIKECIAPNENIGDVGASVVLNAVPQDTENVLCIKSIVCDGCQRGTTRINATGIQNVIKRALEEAGIKESGIVATLGTTSHDNFLIDTEKEAINNVLGGEHYLLQPRYMVGDMLGAETLVNIYFISHLSKELGDNLNYLILCTDYENIGAIIIGR